MRIALADDSALFRSGLVLLLQASGAKVTAEASSGDELIACLFPPARPPHLGRLTRSGPTR